MRALGNLVLRIPILGMMFFEDLPFVRSQEDLRNLAGESRPGLSGKTISILLVGRHEDASFTLRYGRDGQPSLKEGRALSASADLRWIVTARALMKSVRGTMVEDADSLLMGERGLAQALVC